MQNDKKLQPMGDLDTAVKSAHDLYMKGDISNLCKSDQVKFVKGLCASLGLNPLTNPIEFLNLNRRLVPYVKKDGADQLRKLYNVSIIKLDEREVNGCLVVKAYAQLPNGRTDSSTGAVSIGGLKGDALANAIMKAETKAKRRATLSICGLGFMDETETETIPNAKKHDLSEDDKKPQDIVIEKTEPENQKPQSPKFEHPEITKEKDAIKSYLRRMYKAIRENQSKLNTFNAILQVKNPTEIADKLDVDITQLRKIKVAIEGI